MADQPSSSGSSGSVPSTGKPASGSSDKIARPETMIGEFKLLRRLGRGGMSDVYLAEQTSLQRNVAVKVLKRELLKDPNSIQRFKTEATAVAGLNHPNIVQVYTIGEWKGLHYMVQEYVPGQNIREYVSKRGTPDFLLAVHIMRQIATALHQASISGIVHRDIKPENILFNQKGEVKVADFGLAKLLQKETDNRLTEAGMTMGTPLYMSPEQIRGHDVDHRSDLYSFGVTSYHILAGEAPFKGKEPLAIAMGHLNEKAVPLEHLRPDLPILLCKVIEKLMQKNKEDRYQTAAAVLKDLKRLADEENRGEEAVPLTTGEMEAIDEESEVGESWSGSFLDQPFASQLPWMLIAATLLGAVAFGMGLYSHSSDPLVQKLEASSGD
ncbi:MAG: serine/threonine protein kinase [Planctomycetaceae bacterium]|nr:serine/threonine protein kinase [Planctomycetaceae bacterium]